MKDCSDNSGPKSDKMRQKLSDALKAFNRKTGKITLQGNKLAQSRRRAKATAPRQT